MIKKIKRKLTVLLLFQLVILATSMIFQHKITLLSYINISFYFSSALLFSALLTYTIQTGFFDVMSKSFTMVFSKGDEKKSYKDITPISELVSINQKPLLLYGALIGVFMLIALFVYYR